MLHGPNGSNGKSTLLNMIIQLLGDENVSKLSLKDMPIKLLNGIHTAKSRAHSFMPKLQLILMSSIRKLQIPA